MSRVIHFEIPSTDPEVSMLFYRNVFGWSFMPFGGDEYWLAATGDETAPGINGAIMRKRHPEQPMTNSISVPDLDAAMKRVKESGGTIVLEKTPIPGVGWFCYFKDPDQHILGMMQRDEQAK
jgi:uncharacterized protein